MGEVQARRGWGPLEPTAGGGIRPGRGFPGPRGARGQRGLGGAPDLEAETRERVIVWLVVGTDVCREVTGARAGRKGGNCGPGPDGGPAPGPGGRARGPILELFRRVN